MHGPARYLALAVLFLVLGAGAIPAVAGGYATVRLDEPPGAISVEAPWTFGFTVKQHDRTPVNVARAFLQATHRQTGDTITAEATQEGPTGRYALTVTFPRAGGWTWSITPDPFPATPLETLFVLASPDDPAAGHAHAAPSGAAGHPVHIHDGTCASLGGIAYPLDDTGTGGAAGGTPAAGGTVGAPSAVPVAVSVTTVETSLDALIAGPYAINVHESAAEIGSYVACGDLGGPLVDDQLIVGLQPLNNSGDVGIATLRDEGGQAVVTLAMLAVESTPEGTTGTPSAGGGEWIVAIVNAPVEGSASGSLTTLPGTAGGVVRAGGGGGGGKGGWAFSPATLTVPVGATVTWVNETEVPHTVTGRDPGFEDSGLLDPGFRFSQTFTAPGTYRYFCSPHPFMEGVIVVE